MKLKTSNGDITKKNQIMTKLRNSKVSKLKSPNCAKTQKTQIVGGKKLKK